MQKDVWVSEFPKLTRLKKDIDSFSYGVIYSLSDLTDTTLLTYIYNLTAGTYRLMQEYRFDQMEVSYILGNTFFILSVKCRCMLGWGF